jgi:hypothetical protein
MLFSSFIFAQEKMGKVRLLQKKLNNTLVSKSHKTDSVFCLVKLFSCFFCDFLIASGFAREYCVYLILDE